MRSFRLALALRVALSALGLFALLGVASVIALRSMLYRQLDSTLLHIAEIEAQAGAATVGSDFEFHEGVLLGARESPIPELTRYAQLWTSDGEPLVRSKNLSSNLLLSPDALAAAQRGTVGWNTHTWQGRTLRCVLYPLKLVGTAHGVHVLQVAAPVEPVRRTVIDFGLLVTVLTVAASSLAGLVGWRLAGIALRPTGEITVQAEAMEEGTLSARITAHADVEEFSRLVNVLNAMLDRLDRAFQTQRRFTADASHELRAPLTVLRGDIEVALMRNRSPEEYRETLRRCREEVVRLGKLASDLLVLARADAGQVLEHQEDIDLRDVAVRVIDRYSAIVATRGISIHIAGDAALTTGDPQLVERMIGNLVDNAVKHTPDHGTISLVIETGDHAVLEIQDSGPGVAPEHVPQLFERFFRADPARSPSDSTGLGLAIAAAAATAHGGSLEFRGNHPGARFRLTLPASPSEARQRLALQTP